MTTAELHERRRVLFFGRVQGVGFRAITRTIAGRFAVVGSVRNEPDGSVELVAEGTPTELDRFQSAIEAELARFISAREVYRSAARGEFACFSIQH